MIAGDKAAAKCHWHSMVESVGSCAVCGLAGCSTCLVQEAAGMRCRECIQKRRQIIQPKPIPPQPPPPVPPAATPPGQALTVVPQPPPAPLGFPPVQPVPPQSALGRFLPNDPKILLSLFILLAGASLSFLAPRQGVTPSVGDALATGYLFWALFWGAPAAWRLWRKIPLGTSTAFLGCSPMGVGWLLAAFCLLVVGGWFYCVFGGGIYQFLKHWLAVTRRPALQG